MIPKVLNFIWIGDESKRPDGCIDSWRDKHPSLRINVWGNQHLESGDWPLKEQMTKMREINGVADLMRWQLLYEFGGIFLDADSLCLRPLDDWMFELVAASCWANEINDPMLIACSFLAFPPKYPLIKRIIDDINQNFDESQQAWLSVGPGAITRAWIENLDRDLTILPSHFFIPHHHATPDKTYNGSLVYARQLWGSTYKSYGKDIK